MVDYGGSSRLYSKKKKTIVPFVKICHGISLLSFKFRWRYLTRSVICRWNPVACNYCNRPLVFSLIYCIISNIAFRLVFPFTPVTFATRTIIANIKFEISKVIIRQPWAVNPNFERNWLISKPITNPKLYMASVAKGKRDGGSARLQDLNHIQQPTYKHNITVWNLCNIKCPMSELWLWEDWCIGSVNGMYIILRTDSYN